MKFGIRYPDGDILRFRAEDDARRTLSKCQKMIDSGDEEAEYLYRGGVLVARKDGEDEWLEVAE